MGGGANSVSGSSVGSLSGWEQLGSVGSDSWSEVGPDVGKWAESVASSFFSEESEEETQQITDGSFWDNYEMECIGSSGRAQDSQLSHSVEHIKGRLEHIGIHLFAKIIEARDHLSQAVGQVEVLTRAVGEITTQLNRMERSIQAHKVTTVVIASSVAAVVGVVSSYIFNLFGLNNNQVKESSVAQIADEELEQPPIIVAKELRLDHVDKKPIDFANERVERYQAAEKERKRHEELRNAQQAGVKV